MAIAVTIFTAMAALCVGPSEIGFTDVIRELGSRLPLLGISSPLEPVEADIVWQIRMPRVVLALMVGGLLSICGAAYQGVFRNPLADPYLLGTAAGAGLGATVAFVVGAHANGSALPVVPLAAFVGALSAVMLTYTIGNSATRAGGSSTASLILAGVAVTSLLTAVQTFLQQRDEETIREVYTWILGRLSGADWNDVVLITPYAAVTCLIVIVHRRVLDVMSVGDDEARALGVDVNRTRLVVIVGASIGTAAAVSVSGLIGFVGVIVPHAIRLLFGASHRAIVPMSMVLGGGFLVAADVIARTALQPAEIPIGVVTALIGAPFFLVLLRLGGFVRSSR